MDIYKLKYGQIVAVLLSIFVFVFLGYFFNRSQFTSLLLLYTIAFICFLYLFKSNISDNKLFKIGLLFRILFLLTTPFLSQDFYRFIWDGRLIAAGLNPYEFLPNQITNTIQIDQASYLFDKMGSLSASHYSNYPPVNQFLFAVAGFFSGKSILGSIIIFRIIIITADIFIFVFGRRILVTLKQNTRNIFFYFLNPLVILELTGNLHFEGVMLLFLTLGFYFLDKLQTTKAAFLIAISISIKLLPLLILPLFFKRLAFKKSVWFYFLVIFFNILFFFPFINASLISNYLATISLWFTNFEFNSSFYYIVREVGFYVKGYNIIGVVGKIIPILTIALVLFFSFFRNNKTTLSLIPNILLVLTLYFFISTTVHPWYVINLILLSVFTNFRFPLVWSLFVILSYYAYSVVPFKENLLLIFIEYFFVIGFFIYELRLNCKLKIPNNFL